MEARIEKYHNLFVAHYGDLCNYASLFVPRHDAEDVVSDIFTGLIETKNPSDISRNYLYTSVKNRCLNRIRNAQSYKAYQEYIAERLFLFFLFHSSLVQIARHPPYKNHNQYFRFL